MAWRRTIVRCSGSGSSKAGPPARWRNSSIAAKPPSGSCRCVLLAALRVALGHELSSFHHRIRRRREGPEMNEETRLLEVDRMIDEITAVPPGTGRAHAATHVSPSPDRIVVNELRGLGMIDWPADEVGDQIAHAVADTIRYPESEPATEPRHQAV